MTTEGDSLSTFADHFVKIGIALPAALCRLSKDAFRVLKRSSMVILCFAGNNKFSNIGISSVQLFYRKCTIKEFITGSTTTRCAFCLYFGHHENMCLIKDSPVCVHNAQAHLTLIHLCLECEPFKVYQCDTPNPTTPIA